MVPGGYTTLFSGIIYSSVWRETAHTKVLWITLLAMADQMGDVRATTQELAMAAGVSPEQCEEALAVLLSPDPHSRTPDHEGRRIRSVIGGFSVLNYGRYHSARQAVEVAASSAARQARYRERKKLSEHPKPLVVVAVAVAAPKKPRAKPPRKLLDAHGDATIKVVNTLMPLWPRRDLCDGRLVNAVRSMFAERVALILENHPEVDEDMLIAAGRRYCATTPLRYKAPQYYFGIGTVNEPPPWIADVKDLLTEIRRASASA